MTSSLLHPTSAAISSLPVSLEDELKEAKLDFPRPDPSQMIAFKPRTKQLIRKQSIHRSNQPILTSTSLNNLKYTHQYQLIGKKYTP